MARLVGARAYNSGNQTISHNTQTAVTFDSERFDTDTIHSTSSNTSRLTATTAGKYVIAGHIVFASNATGYRQIALRVNGATYIATQRSTAINGDVSVISVSSIYELAATDYVELMVYQNSGGNLNITASANNGSEFAMHRVG